MSRGNAALLWVLRVALLVGALVVVVFASGELMAGAAPTHESFFTPHQVVDFSAISPSGIQVPVKVLVVDSSFLPVGDLSPEPFPTLPPGQAYFHIWLQPQDPVGGAPFIALSFPPADASLATSRGTVTSVGSASRDGSLDAQLYFPVADSTTAATLTIRATTVTTLVGDVEVPYRLQPATISFTTSAPVSVPVRGSAGQGGTPPSGSSASIPASGGGTSSALGFGVGALVLVAIGGAGLFSFRRRRAFARADREGRIMLSGPPILAAGATLPTGAELPADRQAIVVKLLGALEIEGTRRPVTAGPLLEIIVFLALNPGQTFNSAQMRESIWGLGRRPLTSGAFRNYMSQFRKAFGPGVVVTKGFRYEMTDAVTSDWDQFRGFLQADDKLLGREAALALVRGPVLHGAFDGKQNSPFAWAYETANDIEDEVTSVAVGLAVACLELDDPPRAAQAVSQGLLCSDSNLRLRRVDLEVGGAIGGPGEVGRRLDAARAAMGTSFPHDLAALDELARQLGWVAPRSG